VKNSECSAGDFSPSEHPFLLETVGFSSVLRLLCTSLRWMYCAMKACHRQQSPRRVIPVHWH